MRIEDLDGPRVKKNAADAVIELLRWLGLNWDGPVVTQSADLSPYHRAMEQLAGVGVVYPCELTRRQIEQAASAPHGSTGEVAYPMHLRPGGTLPREFDDPQTNWRFAVPPASVRFHDEVAGDQIINPAQTVGDFVVWTRRGQPSYQLAVVVDDALMGVTDVVRGDDLLDSTARQIHLAEALNIASAPTYYHLPLVVGSDGRRLAKRHGDTRVQTYRDRGVSAERIIGLMAYWSGLTDRRKSVCVEEFLSGLDVATLAGNPVTCGTEDHQWLLD